MRTLLTVISLSLLLPLAGCADEATEPNATEESSRPRLVASELKVLVVDDPRISEGLQLLSGEWTERSGGELVIEQSATDDFLAAAELTADLVIYPSRYVGELVQREWIRPVRKSVLESEEAAIKDLFPLVRERTQQYGRTVYGLSLGEPPLMLRLEADTQESTTIGWNEVTNARSQLVYPLAVALLARGVSYAQGRSGTMSCFDPEAMRPRLDSPPFMRALQEMVDRETSDTSVVEAQLCWPAGRSDDSVSFGPLPIPEEVYHPLREAWVENDLERPVTVLGGAGRMVSVSRKTRNPASAFKFLTWLISEDTVGQVARRSQATVWFRKTQTSSVGQAAGEGSADAKLAASVEELLSSPYCFLIPRIPGIDEYLKSLNAAVEAAIRDNQDPSAVLAAVTTQWESLTDQLSRDQQRTAYRMHLGLEVSND